MSTQERASQPSPQSRRSSSSRANEEPPALLKPSGRVLPTLNADGSRRWLRPRLFKGRFWRARRIVGWSLILLFAGLPLVRVGGKPAVLLDVANRQFTFFGRTFLATDGVLLMLLLLSIFVGIFLITAVAGRAWCGWACPQTVYMEFVFRPLERWLEGGRTGQKQLDRQGSGPRRSLKYAIFAVLSVALANVFLAYFVGTEQLMVWMTSAPWTHPAGFGVIAVTSGLVFFDFAYFREQMCTVTCPYARLQSVLLDPSSLIVGYDRRRGEPRSRGAGPVARSTDGAKSGDCIDCKACVVACPTGIDIREGLQLECIHCAQCVDACDSVMVKFKRPTGLVRFDSQQGFAGARGVALSHRLRVGGYSLLLAGLTAALAWIGVSSLGPDVTLLRGIGAPFEVQEHVVRNQIRVKIQNRGGTEAKYALTLLDAPGATLVAPEFPLLVPPGKSRTSSVFVLLPEAAFSVPSRDVRFAVSDGEHQIMRPYRVLGPSTGGHPQPPPAPATAASRASEPPTDSPVTAPAVHHREPPQ